MENGSRLHIAPISLRAANQYVEQLHRHHGPSRGHKFSVSVVDEDGELHGVAIAGRPVARMLDDGHTLEVTRVCTDGTPNACSMLYGAVRRIALAMGYRRDRILTYTLESESGTSLRASGWVNGGVCGGGSWSRATRARVDRAPTERKRLWTAGAEK